MLSLVQIATQKCIQNIARITDVGSTPFHLLEPMLARLNAKQLAQLEARSPQLMPHSDKLWPKLIEKDFPDRPIHETKLQGLSKEDTHMPYKALYSRYQEEKKSFLDDSARRLKAMTEKLKKEKSAKAIVTVPELLRDPTVRRRNYKSMNSFRNPVFEKARREVLGKTRRVFASTCSDKPIRRRPPTQFNTSETQMNEHKRLRSLKAAENKRIYQENLPKITPKPPILSTQALQKQAPLQAKTQPKSPGGSSKNNATPTTSPLYSPVKRRVEPSIFLTRKRPARPNKGTNTSTEHQTNSQTSESPPSKDSDGTSPKIQAIKSSIFQF